MSYNLVDSTTGALTRVAGRGKAEYGASSVRSGTYTPSSSVQVQEDLSFSVTFSEPMPDNDYQVIFGSSSNDTASGTMQCVVRSRSTTGFSGVIRNVGTSEISAASGTFTWFAFKLYSDVEYSNIVNSMPSDASASNKLVAHKTPYSSFTLNNNSGSQKWYKLGNYGSGHYPARLDFVSARVDGQMFESSIRISGDGSDNNYVSWVGERGCEISTISVKVDSSRNIYAKMNSYSAVEIRVYGTFTLNITELNSEPSGTGVGLQKLVTRSDLILTADGDRSTAIGNDVPGRWHIIDNGNYAICIGYNTEAFSVDTPNKMFSMQLPAGYRYSNVISSNVFINGDVSWVTGTSHSSGNGAGTYITKTGTVAVESFRQIVLAIKE